MAVKAKDTPVGATEPAKSEESRPAPRRPYFSESMRHDLDTLGWTVDPTTGKKITADPR